MCTPGHTDAYPRIIAPGGAQQVNFVNFALGLLDHDVAPIPMLQKRPLVRWRRFLNGHPLPTEEEVVKWFTQKDHDAVAAVGRLACLDFDVVPPALPDGREIPPGWYVATPRGLHVFFAWDGPRVDFKVDDGVEFLSAKPLIVAGLGYHPFGDVRMALETPAPAWLVKLAHERANKRHGRPNPPGPPTLVDRLLSSEALAEYVVRKYLRQRYRGLGTPIRCFRHGPDRHPSLAPTRNARGHVVFHDFHDGANFNLVELYVAATGDDLAGASVRTRQILGRLAQEAGLLDRSHADAWLALVGGTLFTNTYLRGGRGGVKGDPPLEDPLDEQKTKNAPRQNNNAARQNNQAAATLFARGLARTAAAFHRLAVDAARNGQILILASKRFLAKELGLPPGHEGRANKLANALAALGLLVKVPAPRGRGGRWLLAFPDLAEAQRRWFLMARAGVSERTFCRRFVATVLGKEVADSVFPHHGPGELLDTVQQPLACGADQSH